MIYFYPTRWPTKTLHPLPATSQKVCPTPVQLVYAHAKKETRLLNNNNNNTMLLFKKTQQKTSVDLKCSNDTLNLPRLS